jgi:hypothetical protein
VKDKNNPPLLVVLTHMARRFTQEIERVEVREPRSKVNLNHQQA